MSKIKIIDLIKVISQKKYNYTRGRNDELFIEISKDQIKNLLKILMDQGKLRFASEFCVAQKEGFQINILLLNIKENYKLLLRYHTQESFISIGEIFPASLLCEEEITALFGLKAEERSENYAHDSSWPLLKSFTSKEKITQQDFLFNRVCQEVREDEGYQIAVGPVHAGIIEPGHFRFTVIGEDIENLEIKLHYKHKGIEKIGENIPAEHLHLLLERVAGESSVAYGEAYALLIEKLLDKPISYEISLLRMILLELERSYNFSSDLAGIALDVGFSYPAKKLSFFAEKIMQSCEKLTGSRLMRHTIVPGGIMIPISKNKLQEIGTDFKKIKSDLDKIIATTIDSFSFLDRVENTGCVYQKTAERLSLTGPAGRSSGISYDVRKHFPYEAYADFINTIYFEKNGSVLERFKVKANDLQTSLDLVLRLVVEIKDDIQGQCPSFQLSPGSEAFTMVESVKGELVLYGKVGRDNCFERLYLKTPSLINWPSLTWAVKGEIVPDFPVCNKSFNFSYAENDK